MTRSIVTVAVFVRITKKPDGRHRLTVVRDDGTVSQGKMIPGFGADAIPHDLLHAVVEKELGFQRGVYGLVNTGLDIADLLAPERKTTLKAEAELMFSELITGVLQAEGAYEGFGPEQLRDELARRCREHGLDVPVLSGTDLSELRRLRDEYQGRWMALRVGNTMEVEL